MKQAHFSEFDTPVKSGKCFMAAGDMVFGTPDSSDEIPAFADMAMAAVPRAVRKSDAQSVYKAPKPLSPDVALDFERYDMFNDIATDPEARAPAVVFTPGPVMHVACDFGTDPEAWAPAVVFTPGPVMHVACDFGTEFKFDDAPAAVAGKASRVAAAPLLTSVRYLAALAAPAIKAKRIAEAQHRCMTATRGEYAAARAYLLEARAM